MGYPNPLGEPSAALFGKVLSCVSPESVFADILEPVAQLLGAESGVYLQFTSTAWDPCHVGDGQYLGSRPRALKAYVDGLYALDPVVKPVIQAPDDFGRASQASLTSFDRSELDGDPYAETFLKRYDIGHVIAMVAPVRTGLETRLAGLGFHRSYGDRPFLPQDLSRFQQLMPALQAVFRHLASREALDMSRAVIEAAGRQGGDFSCLIMDEDLAIRHATQSASEARGVQCGLMDPCVLGDIKQELLTAPPEPGAGRLFTTTTGEGASIEVELRVIQASDTRTYYLASSHGAPLRRSIGSVCEALGFTARETQIARLLVSGQQNASLGMELGISYRTVENHLRSIFRKASVRTRTQLVSRLLSL